MHAPNAHGLRATKTTTYMHNIESSPTSTARSPAAVAPRPIGMTVCGDDCGEQVHRNSGARTLRPPVVSKDKL
jgi:hypothetical protein